MIRHENPTVALRIAELRVLASVTALVQKHSPEKPFEQIAVEAYASARRFAGKCGQTQFLGIVIEPAAAGSPAAAQFAARMLLRADQIANKTAR